jgi:multidrug resistance efflux pump
MSNLGDEVFARLLGSLGRERQEQMMLLQTMLHREMKELDRAINQLERRRRLAMLDAVERAEAEIAQHKARAEEPEVAAPVLLPNDQSDRPGDGTDQLEDRAA